MMLPVRHQRARQCLTPQQTVQLWKHAPPRIKAQRNSLSSAVASPLKREQCGHWAGILEPWLKPDYRSCRVWGGNVISSLIRSAVVLHPVPSVGPCDLVTFSLCSGWLHQARMILFFCTSKCSSVWRFVNAWIAQGLEGVFFFPSVLGFLVSFSNVAVGFWHQANTVKVLCMTAEVTSALQYVTLKRPS